MQISCPIHYDPNLNLPQIHFDFISIWFRLHLDVTAITSLRSHFGFTSNSVRIHFELTCKSLPSHVGSTPMSLRIHFEFTSMSLRSHIDEISQRNLGCGSKGVWGPIFTDNFIKPEITEALCIYSYRYFDVTSNSLRPNFDLTSTSLRRHFEFTSMSLRCHFGFASTATSLRLHRNVT